MKIGDLAKRSVPSMLKQYSHPFQVTVPIFGCNRPKHKPLYELVSEYNSQVNHHANYCWFIPPAGEELR